MSQNTLKIAVVGGDGIGPEVVGVGLSLIEELGVDVESVNYNLGGARYLADGTVLPESVLAEWSECDAIYFGAVGHPEVEPGVIERGLLLKMRFELDLYINLRPFKFGEHDFVVVRENTEGPYVGSGGVLRRGSSSEVATQESLNTRFGVERAIRFAFDQARARRRHLTMVHKTNVLSFAGDLWDRTLADVSAEYPDVETAYNHVDAACIYFVEDPQRYDVIVTDNLFGDILTDLGAAVSGGIGAAASANLNPAGDGPSMFEPVHGSAPDIAGTGKANPIAALRSAVMMLRHCGQTDAADRLSLATESAVSVEGTTQEIANCVRGALFN